MVAAGGLAARPRGVPAAGGAIARQPRAAGGSCVPGQFRALCGMAAAAVHRRGRSLRDRRGRLAGGQRHRGRDRACRRADPGASDRGAPDRPRCPWCPARRRCAAPARGPRGVPVLRRRDQRRPAARCARWRPGADRQRRARLRRSRRHARPGPGWSAHGVRGESARDQCVRPGPQRQGAEAGPHPGAGAMKLALPRFRTFRDKVSWLVTVTSAVAIVSVAVVLAGAHHVALRKATFASLEAQTRIAALNSGAPLVFGDRATAEEVLEAFRTLPSVDSATLYTLDGMAFARYRRTAGTADEGGVLPLGFTSRGGRVVSVIPVEEKGQALGRLQ